MAGSEMLVLARNVSATKPAGSPVVMRSDRELLIRPWGAKERPPTFVVIVLPDVDPADITFLAESDLDLTEPNPVLRLKHVFRYQLDDTFIDPGRVRPDGKITRTRAQLDAATQDRRGT